MASENIFPLDEKTRLTSVSRKRRSDYEDRHRATEISWRCMRGRCDQKSTHNYFRYGGAGISYQKEWKDYDRFLLDIGERPEKTTLDRIDSSKNYSKENCRWATWAEQANNRSNNVKLTFRGITRNTLWWSKELGINRTTIEERIKRGHSVESALTYKNGKHFNKRRLKP